MVLLIALWVLWDSTTKWELSDRGPASEHRGSEVRDVAGEGAATIHAARADYRDAVTNRSELGSVTAAIALSLSRSDRTPIAGANGAVLSAAGAPASNSIHFTTDDDGRAHIPIAAGRWILRVSVDPDGFRKVETRPGETTAVDYRLYPGVVLTGTVVDTGDAPIADAAIEVTSFDSGGFRMLATRTDPSGAFETYLGDGRGVIVASAPGYAPGIADVHAKAGEHPHRRIVLQRDTRIVGVVRDVSGEPVPGARIAACAVKNYRAVLATMGVDTLFAESDSTGRFELAGLALGSVLVRAQRRGYQQGETVVVTGLDVDTKCRIDLTPAAELRGVICSADGQPIAAAGVAAFVEGQRVAVVRTDDRGSYHLRDIPRGLVTAWAHHVDHGWCVFETLAEGPAGAPRTERVAPGIEVRGKVVDDRGWPVPEVLGAVSFLDAAGHRLPWQLQFSSDREGRFVIPNIDPRLVMSVAGYRNGHDPARRRVAANEFIELTMPRRVLDGTVVGRVVDSNGEPVAGAAVTVQGTGQSGSHGFHSNKAGKFRIDGVPRGPFLIVLRKDGYARTGVTGFASKNGGEIDVGDVVILPGGSVAVHVESRSRAAVNGACAVIGAGGCTVDKFLIIDGHGESATVPAGDYDLLVSARGFELNHEPVRIEIGERAEARILVRSGEWVQVAVACPPQFSTSERLRVRMLSAGRELASYTIAPTPAGNSYHTRVAAGDAEFQVDVRVGEFSASARCRVNDLPRIDDRPTLTLQLEGVR